MKEITQQDLILLNIISKYITNPNDVTLHYGVTTLGCYIEHRTPAQKMRDDANELEEKEQNIIKFKELIEKLNK